MSNIDFTATATPITSQPVVEARNGRGYFVTKVEISDDLYSVQKIRNTQMADDLKEKEFYRLRPFGRVYWLIKNDFMKFVLLILGLAAGAYLSLDFVILSVASTTQFIISVARADPEAKIQKISSISDVTTIVLLGFVGISLFAGAIVWLWSREKSKSDQGFELVKTFGVGAMGFIAGMKKG